MLKSIIESMLANGRWGGHFVRRSPPSGTPFSPTGHNVRIAALASIVLFCSCSPAAEPKPEFSQNEIAAAAACRAYAEAQEIYHRTDYDRDGILEYAQSICGHGKPKAPDASSIPEPTEIEVKALAPLLMKLASEDFSEREAASAALEKLGPGAIKLLEKNAKESTDAEVRHRCSAVANMLKLPLMKSSGLDTREGLFQTARGDGDLALVDRAFAAAEGNPSDHPTPKAGYCFKILAGQGEMAAGGRRSYLMSPAGAPNQRNMTLGYALIAYPAQYEKTGRHCFIINSAGTIYQKDMGQETSKLVEAMTEFNPDETWVPSE